MKQIKKKKRKVDKNLVEESSSCDSTISEVIDPSNNDHDQDEGDAEEHDPSESEGRTHWTDQAQPNTEEEKKEERDNEEVIKRV